MSRRTMFDRNRLDALDRELGVRFKDAELREIALTHRSYAFENELTTNNERLELLGDAVLDLVVTDMAFSEFPDMSEGELSKLRAAIVNEIALADVARRNLRLGRFILLGKGEEMSGGHDKSSILADALEALLGAIYRDRGLETARELIERLFRPRMISYTRGKFMDYKTILQELASAHLQALPEYQISERGPDHQKEFTATVRLAGKPWGNGIGRSKKEAEQRAAQEAHDRLIEKVE
jgi:ribonuclease III